MCLCRELDDSTCVHRFRLLAACTLGVAVIASQYKSLRAEARGEGCEGAGQTCEAGSKGTLPVLLAPSSVTTRTVSMSEGLACASAQKGEGSAVVDARRKELAAQRAAAGSRGAKQFYRVTVRVQPLALPHLAPRQLHAEARAHECQHTC